MATDDDGYARGYAFVEYENPVSPLLMILKCTKIYLICRVMLEHL